MKPVIFSELMYLLAMEYLVKMIEKTHRGKQSLGRGVCGQSVVLMVEELFCLCVCIKDLDVLFPALRLETKVLGIHRMSAYYKQKSSWKESQDGTRWKYIRADVRSRSYFSQALPGCLFLPYLKPVPVSL